MQGRTTLLGTAPDLWQVLLRSESSGVMSVWWSLGRVGGEPRWAEKGDLAQGLKAENPAGAMAPESRARVPRARGSQASELERDCIIQPPECLERQSKAEPQLRGVEGFKSQGWFEAKHCESLVLLMPGRTDFLVFSFLISDCLALIPFYNGKPFNFWVSYFKIVHPVLMVPKSPDENVFNWNEQWLRSSYPCYCGFILLTTISIRECAAETEVTGDWRQVLIAQNHVSFSGASCVSGWCSYFFLCLSSPVGCELLEGLVSSLWSLRMLCMWFSESITECAYSGSRLTLRLPQSPQLPPLKLRMKAVVL